MADRGLKILGLTAVALGTWLIPKALDLPPVWRAAFGVCGVLITLTAAKESTHVETDGTFLKAERVAEREKHATALAYGQMAFEAELEQRLGLKPATPHQSPAHYLTVNVNGDLSLPVEDLAQTLADSGSDEQNFLFVGKSRSGKTSLLVNAIARKDARHSGLVDWYIFNGKPERDNDWGGLASSSQDYWPVNSEEKASEMFGQFLACVKALQDWQNSGEEHYPMFIVGDEINNQRILLSDPKRKLYDRQIALFATQCMSEQSGLWISTHSHAVDDIGLNKRLQQNFQVIVLGRQGKYESIGYALDDEYLIRDKELRAALKAQLQAYIQTGQKGAIAFTNQGGDSRLVALPHYSKDVRVSNSLLNASVKPALSEEGVQQVRSLRDQLEAMWSLPPADSPHDNDDAGNDIDLSELPEILQPLIEYVMKNTGRWFTAREIRSNVRFYKENGISTEQIRTLFLHASSMGVGSVDGEGDRLRYRL